MLQRLPCPVSGVSRQLPTVCSLAQRARQRDGL
nr:MAG TPA_asm: hypothetical protein [Caudoviricetes sp.]